MAITIKEIAEICNTSRGTVDRVINNRGNVNSDLQRKILDVIEKYNYKPNVTAKVLVKSKKKYTIGVVINSLGNKFFNDVLEGIEKARKKIANYNIDVIIKEIKGYDEDRQLEAIEELEKEKISALVLTPVYSKSIIKKIKELKEKNIPTVLTNADIDESDRLAVVSSDNYKSGKVAGQIASLTLQNNSNVAIITGSFNNLGHIKRTNGFKEIIENSDKEINLISVMENNDDNAVSYKVVKKLLESNKKLDLIYFTAGGVEGGIEAIEESLLNTKAITMDESDFVREYIKKGIINASITQQPFVQGYKPITLLADYLVLDIPPKKPKIHTNSEIIINYSF